MKKINTKVDWKKMFTIGLSLFGLTLIGTLVVSSILIGESVSGMCMVANNKYKNTDCVESLIIYMQDENGDIRLRRRSVWALGQIGDKRALKVLKDIDTDKPCSSGKCLGSYEVNKAIKLCEGNLNIAGIIWKPFFKVK